MPNFLIVGATKAGTTSLHAYLARHPAVFMHPAKEMRFFTVEHNHHLGLDWYQAQFAGSEGFAAVGEASNAYTRSPLYPGVPGRIAAVLPEVRLIYILREPMRRLESHYRHRLVTGREWRSPDEAFRADKSYVAAGLYGAQLSEYLRYFDREQILLLQSERLFADPPGELRRLADFLGVPDHPELDFGTENAAATRPVAPVALRRLNRFGSFRRPVRRLVRAISRSPMARHAQTADRPAYALSERGRAELAETYARDRELLTALAGKELVDGWSAGTETRNTQ